MSEKTAEVLSTVDLPSRDPKRVGKIDVMVTYKVGPFQTGMVFIPKEKLDEGAIDAAIKADIEKKAKFIGHTVKV